MEVCTLSAPPEESAQGKGDPSRHASSPSSRVHSVTQGATDTLALNTSRLRSKSAAGRGCAYKQVMSSNRDRFRALPTLSAQGSSP